MKSTSAGRRATFFQRAGIECRRGQGFAYMPGPAFSSVSHNNRVCCDVYFLPGVCSSFSDELREGREATSRRIIHKNEGNVALALPRKTVGKSARARCDCSNN